MSQVTQILQAIETGDPKAADQLLPLVYDELRKLAAARMAAETPGPTLEATALVPEAYLRLVATPRQQQRMAEPRWDNRGRLSWLQRSRLGLGGKQRSARIYRYQRRGTVLDSCDGELALRGLCAL